MSGSVFDRGSGSLPASLSTRVDTVATSVLLTSFNWPEKTERYNRVARFVDAFFSHIDEFHKPPRHPKWKGCGFLRTTAELANMPGHPAMKVGAAHKKKFENWMRLQFEAEGIEAALPLARQIMLLMDGSFAVTLLHRDPSYMETAGDAAYALIKADLAARSRRGKR